MVLLAVLECFGNDERWLDQSICVIEGAFNDYSSTEAPRLRQLFENLDAACTPQLDGTV